MGRSWSNSRRWVLMLTYRWLFSWPFTGEGSYRDQNSCKLPLFSGHYQHLQDSLCFSSDVTEGPWPPMRARRCAVSTRVVWIISARPLQRLWSLWRLWRIAQHPSRFHLVSLAWDERKLSICISSLSHCIMFTFRTQRKWRNWKLLWMLRQKSQLWWDRHQTSHPSCFRPFTERFFHSSAGHRRNGDRQSLTGTAWNGRDDENRDAGHFHWWNVWDQ